MRRVIRLFLIVFKLIDASWPSTRGLVRSLTILLLVSTCWSVARVEDLPRLQVSDNARYLVTENGRPFFWLGDTAWSLIDQSVRTASDDQPGVERYFQIRKQQGFNVVQTHFLTNLVRGPIDAPNAYGHLPFIDGDFARPCLVPGPANDYWDHADYVIDLAERYGMYVAIVAAWSNSLETDEHPLIRTPEAAYAYGRFLGERYRNRTHIVWLLGGDAFGRPNRAILSAVRRRMTRALAEGITDGTSGDDAFDNYADWTRTLMSYHPPGGGKSSSLFLHDEPWLDFNMIQSTTRFGFKNYETVNADYARKPPKPTFDAEVAYEYSLPLNQREQRQRPGDRITAWDVRRAAYWNVFAGGFGHTYGHRNLIGWVRLEEEPLKHGADQPWFESLDTPGALQMNYLKVLIASRPMLIRIPDQSLIMTGSGEGIHHAQATRGADGSYAFVYLPTGKDVTIDLNKLNGKTLISYWYDPQTGKSSLLDTFPKVGSRLFTPPAHGKGQDWVLVLDDASCRFSQPGIVQPWLQSSRRKPIRTIEEELQK